MTKKSRYSLFLSEIINIMVRIAILNFLSLASLSSGFVVVNNKMICGDKFVCAAVSRRELLSTASIVTASVFAQPVWAKEELPITAENIEKYFNDVRYELEDPEGGIPRIENALANRDWGFIKEFTKGYDLDLRKKKMGYARKMMTDSKMKDEALTLRNGVTFDLIAVNKAARVQDANACQEALQILKDDVKKFLAMKEFVEVP